MYVAARSKNKYHEPMQGSPVGIGLDVVEIQDVARARYKERVAEYFLTERELSDVPAGARMTEHLASRFALKEAVIKAFPEQLSPFDFYIEKEGLRPCIKFIEPTRDKAYSVCVSLTHTARIAAAVALVYER